MSKLTAERCKQRIIDLQFKRDNQGMSNQMYDYLEALEIALPMLEQQERDEWIEWGGGECPVGYHTRVVIRYFDGEESKTIAGQVPWNHCGDGDDIIAYRIIPEQPTNQNGEAF